MPLLQLRFTQPSQGSPAEYGTGHDDMETSNGTITLEYITELQAKVSTAMSNGELPFVSSYAVYENPYRLHIIVTSNAETDLSKLKAFDSIGGDLEIEYDANHISAVEEILTEIREAAKNRDKNLLALSIEAARRRVTLGEISDALESNFGRYKANIKTISGVYAMNANKNEYFEKAVALTQKFEDQEGRRPRIMVAKMGQDGHDRGAKVVATAFADMGFDVDVAPLFQTPEEVAKQAVENDIHILGVSSLAAGHKTLVPQVVEELKKLGADDITIVVGGVIPQQDYDFLYANGADFIFGPGTNLPKSAVEILEKFLR